MTKKIETLIEKIQDKLQAKVPGYFSCRPALVDLRSFNIQMECQGEDVILETVQAMGYITITLADGKRGWVEHKKCTKQELEIMLAAIDLALLLDNSQLRGKYIRAYNPWWFFSGDTNKTLDDIINRTQQEYIDSITPKTNEG